MKTQQVWFVTGASKGLGLTLVKKLLATGAKVAATSRSQADLEAAVSEATADFLPLGADITNESSVAAAIEKTVETFGRIDVVVNNAGYALTGGLEELTDAEVRQNFEVNVFGTLNVVRHTMPHLRTQQSGHIFNISSIGGYVGAFPGFGAYCSTKYAVVGLTESLAEEARPFGVHVTVVAPGYFRTDFLTAGSLATPSREMPEYEHVRESQRAHQFDINGSQPGDPEKAAAVLIEVAGMANPPQALFLGEDAYNLVTDKLKNLENEIETWKKWTVSTGFEQSSN